MYFFIIICCVCVRASYPESGSFSSRKFAENDQNAFLVIGPLRRAQRFCENGRGRGQRGGDGGRGECGGSGQNRGAR